MTRPSKSSDKVAKRRKTALSSNIAKPYEPTPRERAAMETLIARREERKPAPSLKVMERKGAPEI